MNKYLILIIKIVLGFHLVFIAVSLCFVFYVKNNNPSFYALMVYRKYINHYNVYKPEYIKINNIPTDIRKAIVTVEDYNFYKHAGFDIDSIMRAIDKNIKIGRNEYGASTITQQLARTLFLYPKKSFLRKYFELIIALEMEAVLSKERILELYLNTIEWGKGIFGINNASMYYYNKDIKNTDYEERARLVTIISNPIANSPYNFKFKQMDMRYELILKYCYTNNITNDVLKN